VNSPAKEIISPFEKLLVDLTACGVDYAVVGGVAVIANGYVRLTEDLDIVVKESPPNQSRISGRGCAISIPAQCASLTCLPRT